MFLLLCPTLHASDINLVVIDSHKAIYESLAGQKAFKELTDLKKAKNSELEKIFSTLKSLEQEITAKSATLNAVALEELQLKYDDELKKKNRFVKDTQEELKRKELQLLKPIMKGLDEVIKDYAIDNSVDIMLDKRNPVVIFNSDKMNITDKILKLYDKQYTAEKE